MNSLITGFWSSWGAFRNCIAKFKRDSSIDAETASCLTPRFAQVQIYSPVW